MKKTLLEVYALIICMVSLCVVVIDVVGIMQSSVRVMHPTLDMASYEYDRYQSNDAFWQFKKKEDCDPDYSLPDRCKAATRPPEEQLSKQRTEAYQLELASVVHKSVKAIVDDSIRSLIFVIVFLVHWKMALRARKEAAV